MPLYPFHCSRCGAEFERFLRPAEAETEVSCPSCGAPARSGEPEKAAGDTETPGSVCGVPKGS